MQRSTRNILLLLGLVVIVAAASPLIDGLIGMAATLSDGYGTPHEVFGMLPSEWRTLRDSVLLLVLVALLVGSWLVGFFVINQAKRYKTGTPFCESCNYSLLDLPEDSVCPECGSDERVLSRPEPMQRRLAVVATVQVLGTGGLLLCLFALVGDEPGLMLFHAAMTLPFTLVVMDKRLSANEVAIVSSITLLAICSLTAHAVWSYTHSTDGQAAIGLLGASCSGWLFAGPGYLAAALVVYFYRRHQAKRGGGTV